MTFQRFVGAAALATGRVEKLRADLVVFDPDTVETLDEKRIADLPAGEERLVQKAGGYQNLVVNGQVLMEDSEHTGVYPGRVLRSHTAVPPNQHAPA